ncbi:Conserved hypothetical protein [Clostridium acetobutylicum EA 2018]|uniref:Uncharacterized protein n=1 Tax=Clostridium acetobutylicum (strain ATCC 824 / DSM 792 / JCM 1419 / IAM 19013 / LMG 5710 / NBRC 13948 / NRRL B-527 / VKM B-1787 / 2291 / W) TaxID=272562 RepID=Q97GV7_CLOAB|nr:Hypothetical protein CA_C2258 [Clostridium acetobutylicum ATCC 824]ADZ21310.1 Conserved hypothetical protein [Clostridium acetobutylicum EA 2018]AEI32251.1 hypothetical protein SMB_G2291 [Clostridium acetobutylicum DSM 1731]AWV79361.1 hypothetical protein DK921_04465 [Clostridium acetobutylicum]PSM07322.1 hypothetical protein C7T89_04465 [Clostridium sp. NJ4]
MLLFCGKIDYLYIKVYRKNFFLDTLLLLFFIYSSYLNLKGHFIYRVNLLNLGKHLFTSIIVGTKFPDEFLTN